MLTLEPTSVEAAEALQVLTPAAIRQAVPSIGALQWLLQNYQNEAVVPAMPGVTSTRALSLEYQLAVWGLNAKVDLEQLLSGPYSEIARAANRLVESAKENGATQPPPVLPSPAIVLERTDRFTSGNRFRISLPDEHGDGEAVTDQLVTLSVEGTPRRSLSTDGDGNTPPIDVDYRRSMRGELTASWDYKLPAGSVLTNGSQVVLLAQTLGSRITSGVVKNSGPDPKSLPSDVLRDTFDALPPGAQAPLLILVGIGIALWFVVAAVKGKILLFLRRFVIWTLVVTLLVGGAWFAFLWTASKDTPEGFDASWADSPSPPANVVGLTPVSAAASSEFFNGATTGRYGPACVIAGKAAGTGRPWMSARGGGLPQVIRVTLADPSVVSEIRIVPGWSNGQPEDFVRAPRPTWVRVIGDSGITQAIRIPTTESAEQARNVPARAHPHGDKQRVRGGSACGRGS